MCFYSSLLSPTRENGRIIRNYTKILLKRRKANQKHSINREGELNNARERNFALEQRLKKEADERGGVEIKLQVS